MYKLNDDNDVYLYYHRWNNQHKNISTTKPTPAVDTNSKATAYALHVTETPVKDDDLSTTNTLETLCTFDTGSSYHKGNINNDMIINLTI